MPRGINTSGDVLSRTLDGRDLNDLWNLFREALDIKNEQRDQIFDLLSFRTTLPGEEVFQNLDGAEFEESSELGVPVSVRIMMTPLTLGFPMKDFDLGKRLTFKFLRDALASQVEALHNAAMEGDNRNMFRRALSAAFNNVSRTNKEGFTVYPFWNNDGIVPPEFNGVTFLSSHSHYFTSGAATFDAADVDVLLTMVEEHGYALAGSDTQGLLFANPAQMPTIRAFRAATGARADFIPSAGGPPRLEEAPIIGAPVSPTFDGHPVAGSLGNWLVLEDYLIPPGYLLAIASGGANSGRNALAMREHPNASYRGLILIEGPRPSYPIQESYYVRTAGFGVRHRGGGAAMQVAVSGTYTPPANYALT